ncbi:PadR family transcriptional regulator [Nonomuraea jiangxiensis]|uniref:DNA-binding transcriptional regulator, PadR family n=1 Tax=Nonomuraea jiangxiensis TaxID=633440 RepID=A0A1G8CWK2_9ACTN|nr:PadR family transcriptional regulator [Nonomuraea jiangxiensis]SDH49340.1 DNA-binding transcriptional regulator, PadR family [Nonomuraea jiangxiensis]
MREPDFWDAPPPPPLPGPPPSPPPMRPMPLMPGPPPHLFQGEPPAPRIRRGDVRAALLALLHEGPLNGYQMIQDIEERSLGVWRPSPGSVYPALQQLEDEGLVTGDESGGSRTYRLTERGGAAAARHAGEAPWEEVARTVPAGHHELRRLWAQLNEAFSHLMSTASDRQLAEAKKLIKQTRKSVFQILAED